MKHLQWLDKILEVQRQHNRVNSNHLLLAWTQLPFKQQRLISKTQNGKKSSCSLPSSIWRHCMSEVRGDKRVVFGKIQ